ncbi:hypothetical protein BXU01_00330 [[Flexibacter] sp. ATCC 35103]|nr:hypothetical protein BXU01_00330 [[Flexibacter] sp. ATCC 35103]
MQGIDNREHRNLLDVFYKYEQMSVIDKNNVTSEEYSKIQKDMEELAALYNNFKFLLAELKKCAKDYELKKKSTRSMLHKRIRLLVAKLQKRNVTV